MSSPTSAPVQRILDLLANLKSSGAGWTALCPAHDDHRNSLSVGEGYDGRALLMCFAGCDVTDIVAALNLEMRELFPEPPAFEKRSVSPSKGPANKHVVATYNYCDERGLSLYQIVRYRPKDFRPRRLGKSGDWIYDLGCVRRVLYNLPDIITATNIIVVEGEKDANRVKKALAHFKKWKGVDGWAVTTCSGGAKGWRPEFAPYFAGKACYFLPDNDEPGRKFAQTVAQDVLTYARRVKVVDLPGLPKKGDVSDYLESHCARDLQVELRAAPLYEAANSHTDRYDASSFNIELLRDLFDAPEERQKWLVEDLLPAGGMSLLAGKPKAGKSTLARQLALSVATGNPFLQRETQQGTVIYLALEEKRQEVKDHFRALGATGGELIQIHYGSAPVAAMAAVKKLLQRHPASLLIIDPLFKFTRVKDGNDYAQMTTALEPVLALARETGTHVICVHHAGKAERSDTTDAILGSTAILGNVDTAMILARRDNYRTILTRQRYGIDLPESILNFDPDRRAMTLGASREQAEQEKVEQDIMAFLGSNAGAREAEILDAVSGRKQGKVAALRRLLNNRVRRQGKAGKSDPYKYSLVPCSPDRSTTAGTRTQNRPKPIESNGEIVVPRSAGTTGNKNHVSRSSNGRSLASRRAYNGAVSPTEFLEQVAILQVDGGLSRVEAARAVRKSMCRERQ